MVGSQIREGDNSGVAIVRRALVLGSGGTTGLAWQAGVLAGLDDAGIDLAAQLVVGTSGGALLGARLAAGMPVADLAALVHLAGTAGPGGRAGLPGSVPAPALARLLAAQLYPRRRHALAWLGRRARQEWTPEASARFVAAVAGDLVGRPWPAALVVVATDTATGRPAFLSAARPADLAAAVAASCAMPGVLPAVAIDGRLLFDGGLRSPGNLDVAAAADAVLALAPLTGALRAHRRPGVQAAQLRRSGTPVLLLTPDAAGRRAVGVDVLAAGRVPAAFAAGRALGVRRAGEVRAAWA